MRLKEKYEKEIVPEIMEKFSLKNRFEVPRLEKIVLNTSFAKMISGKTKEEKENILKEIISNLKEVSGQKPIFTLSKRSISGFSLKKGEKIGAKATLRRKRAFEFLEKLINVVLPRVRDFKGIKENSFTKEGILTIGIPDITAFPEISPERLKFNFGLEANIVFKGTKKKNLREIIIEILKKMNLPIK